MPFLRNRQPWLELSRSCPVPPALDSFPSSLGWCGRISEEQALVCVHTRPLQIVHPSDAWELAGVVAQEVALSNRAAALAVVCLHKDCLGLDLSMILSGRLSLCLGEAHPSREALVFSVWPLVTCHVLTMALTLRRLGGALGGEARRARPKPEGRGRARCGLHPRGHATSPGAAWVKAGGA